MTPSLNSITRPRYASRTVAGIAVAQFFVVLGVTELRRQTARPSPAH